MIPRPRFGSSFAMLSVSAALLFGSGVARAAPPGPDALPITVLAIQTADADEQADGLTKALRASVRALPGWSLADGDYSLEVVTLELKCADPIDATCQSRIADQVKADRYVWGNLKKRGGNVTGELHLWMRGKGSTKVPVDYAANLTDGNDDTLRKIATDAFTALTGGAPKGSVHIKAGSVDGQVFVDDQPFGALSGGEGIFLIPSGTHRIVVKAPGYQDVESSVVVKANATSDLSVTMTKGEPKAPANWKKIAGFASLGVGVATVAVGVIGSIQVFSVQKSSDYKAYQDMHKGAPDVCQIASGDNQGIVDLCSKASTWETVQFVFYPIAAVTGGVGIYLLATGGLSSDKPASPQTGFTFEPMIGPQAGKLQVTYRW